MTPPTPSEMAAACKAAFALERAKGVPLDSEDDLVFAVGFAAGAQWAIDLAREIVKS